MKENWKTEAEARKCWCPFARVRMAWLDVKTDAVLKARSDV